MYSNCNQGGAFFFLLLCVPNGGGRGVGTIRRRRGGAPLTKRTTTTARLCRFRKRRSDRRRHVQPETRPPFCARGGGQKEASLRGARPGEVARKHRQRRGGRGGAAGDQVVVVRVWRMLPRTIYQHLKAHRPTSPLTGLYPCSFPPSGGGIHKKSVLFFGTKDDYANRASFGGLLPQTKEGAQPKKKPKSATSRR